MRPLRLIATAGEGLDHDRFPEVTGLNDKSLLITSGPMLCRLRIWTEAEWAVLPDARRPERYTHVPGLGWIGAIPIACLN
jgi:hypothetical protein